eukprot:TRINITY_DN1202_c0_g3_i2.p1 TRINITY_DN1202_c0_g3~~TRINITY_DN1202_c0_g3_i2.p1  ORF type:complete len:218 (-),score=95.61 TRINITY_DN1202_c0_g3_i2:497-1069(-)
MSSLIPTPTFVSSNVPTPSLDAPNAYLIDQPSISVSLGELAQIGVIYFKIDADNYDQEGKLGAICQQRNYTYRDFVYSTKIPNLQDKLKTFLEEHIHDDEEIRFFLDGSGYFDVRDLQDRWVRIELKKHDMIILPAGIYHRFVPDDKLYFHVMRLFVGEPIWTPYNRCETETNQRPSRLSYVRQLPFVAA